MSDLRNHLESARAKHRSQRYPGNLATELLAEPRHTLLKIFTAAAAVSGIAAAIILWIGSRPLATPTVPNSPIAIKTATQPVDQSSDQDAVAPVTTLAAVPEFPQDTPMAPTLESDDVPMAPSFDSIEIGAIPSLPSMDMSFTDTNLSAPSQTKTSKEST